MSTPQSYLSEFTNFTAQLNHSQHVPSPVGSGADLSAALEAERRKVADLQLKSQSIIGEADFTIRNLKKDNLDLAKDLDGKEVKLTAAEQAVEDAKTALNTAIQANLQETAQLKKDKTDLELKLQTAEKEAKDAKDALELAEKTKNDLETANAQLTTDLNEAKALNNQQGAGRLGLPTPAGAPAAGQAPVVAGQTTEQGVTTPAVVQLTAEQIAQQALEAANPEAAATMRLKNTMAEFRRLTARLNTFGGRKAKEALDTFRSENQEAIFQAQNLGY